MGGFTLYIMTALSLVFVIEGLLYALFPGAIKRMMSMAISMDEKALRMVGLAAAGSGFLMIWLLSLVSGSSAVAP
jgi:uncharacterized protein YjeT (DUF2065 family)